MRDFTLVSPFAALSLAVGAPPHTQSGAEGGWEGGGDHPGDDRAAPQV